MGEIIYEIKVQFWYLAVVIAFLIASVTLLLTNGVSQQERAQYHHDVDSLNGVIEWQQIQLGQYADFRTDTTKVWRNKKK